MRGYPEDVVSAAKRYVDEAHPPVTWTQIIAEAILDERERCADCVRAYQLLDHPRLSPGSEMNAWWSGQERAYEIARRKILKLPLPTSGGEA